MIEVAEMRSGRLVEVEIDPAALAAAPFLEAERQIAMHDIVTADNHFVPAGGEGAFRLKLSLADRKLALDITDEDGAPVARHILSFNPLSRVIRDYFMICQSYESAEGKMSPARFEAIDMGRRGIHNEGATLLRERLQGKIDMDFDTARRLFTLVCALNWRDRQEA